MKMLTLVFTVEDSIYGKIFIPDNELAKDIVWAGERRSITEDGIKRLSNWFEIVTEEPLPPIPHPAANFKKLLESMRSMEMQEA